ncbi:MAG: UDP-N-acetylglucosamine--N-acetylmuramyl-(pentapeptide) pyrophosphoryl-undecaprenol N-acetylglucosamine transferase [Clostridia bacterium]
MKSDKTIVLTGGGTAGHVMVHVAILPELLKNFSQVHYIGTNSIEQKIMSDKNVVFHEIKATKFTRGFTCKNFLLPFKLLKSINDCKNILKKIKPNVIFSKGGFVSLPVVIAGHKLGIPIVSHESDFSFGLANKIILKKCNKMCLTFCNTSKNKKCVCTGLPLRKNLKNGNPFFVKCLAKFNCELPNLLIFGGSLGSKIINKTIKNCVKELTKMFNVVHIVGKNNLEKKLNFLNDYNIENYYQIEYANNMPDFFAWCDYILSRAGANTIFENLELKKPMLLIPLSKKGSRGDQIQNAKYFEKLGYAKVLLEENLSETLLILNLKKIVQEKNLFLQNFNNIKSNNSNENVLNVILEQSN